MLDSGFTGLGKRKQPGQDTKVSVSSSSASRNLDWIEQAGVNILNPRHRPRIGSVSDARVLLYGGDILQLGTDQIQAEFLRFRRDDLVVRILDKTKSLADDQMLPQNEGRKLKEGEVAVSLTDRVIADESLTTRLRAGQRSIKGVDVCLYGRSVRSRMPLMKLPLLKDLPGFIGQPVCIGGDGVVHRVVATLLNVDLERQLVAVRTREQHTRFDHLGRLHLLDDPGFKRDVALYGATAAYSSSRIGKSQTRDITQFVLGKADSLRSTAAEQPRLDAPSSWFKERGGSYVYVLPLDQVKIATPLLQTPSDTDPSVRAQLKTGQRGVMWDRLVKGAPMYLDDGDRTIFGIRVINRGTGSTSDLPGLPPCHGPLIDPIFGYLPPKQDTLMGCWYARRGDVVRVGAENPIALSIVEAGVLEGIGYLLVKADTVIPPSLLPHVVTNARLVGQGLIGITLERIDATFDSWPSDLEYDDALKDARVISRDGKAVDAVIVPRRSSNKADIDDHGWIDIASHEQIPWLEPYAIDPGGPTTFKFHYGELPAVDCGVRLGNFVPGRPDLLSQKELRDLASQTEKPTIMKNGEPVRLMAVCDSDVASLIDPSEQVAWGAMGQPFDMVAFESLRNVDITKYKYDPDRLRVIGMSSAEFRLLPQDARVDVVAPEELLTVRSTSAAPRKLRVRVPDSKTPSLPPLLTDTIELRKQRSDMLGGINSTFRVPTSMSPVTWRTLMAHKPVLTEKDPDDGSMDFVIKTQPQRLPTPAPKALAPSDSTAPGSGSGQDAPIARTDSSNLSRLNLQSPQQIQLTTTRTGTDGSQTVSDVPDLVFYEGRFADQATGMVSVVIGVPADASPETHEILRAAGSIRETSFHMGEVSVTEYHIPAIDGDD